MNQDTKHESESVPPATPGGTQETALPHSNNGVPPNNDASPVIVQCLLIAARRGRQIRLAREQAVQRRQSESRSVIEEAPESDET